MLVPAPFFNRRRLTRKQLCCAPYRRSCGTELLRRLTRAKVLGQEAEFDRLASRVQRQVGQRVTAPIVEKEIITSVTANAIEGLTVMRNVVSHREATKERVAEYVTLADSVLFAIRQNARDHDRRATAAPS